MTVSWSAVQCDGCGRRVESLDLEFRPDPGVENPEQYVRDPYQGIFDPKPGELRVEGKWLCDDCRMKSI